METVEYIELFWDCPNCGHTHISAVSNSQGNRCPNCLHWRTEDISLYEAPDSQIITDPTLINRKPFWTCKVCQAVNEDTGLSAHLLQCGNCDNYQTSEVGGITGNQADDREAPDSLPVGEPVEYKNTMPQQQAAEKPAEAKRSRNWLGLGLAGFVMATGGFLGGAIWSAYQANSSLLSVQVNDLKWAIEVDVQERRPSIHQDWKDSVPEGAVIQETARKQRGVRQEQQGWRTVMVPEQYQSGTRSETYYASEQYQSGDRSETYYASEQYQSGSRQDCHTTSMGNGIGKRTCRDVPVYSTRQVSRTRTVPVYSTRQVPRTRTIPIYSTRMVSRQEPIMVSLPVYDTWATYRKEEWVPKQTYRQTGQQDSQRRSPIVKLQQRSSQRLGSPRATCQLSGFYSVHKWFQAPQTITDEWTLPCPDYDRINIGDRVILRRTGDNSVSVVDINRS